MYPGLPAVSMRKYVYATLPTLIIVSGVFQYFRNSDVLGFIADAKKAFADAELVFDATNTKGLEFANKYVRKTGNASALMHCAIDDPAAFAREAGCELVEVRPFYAAVRRILKSKAGLYTRITMAVTDRTGRAFILHVKLWPGTHADEAIRPREDGGTEPLPTLPADVRADVYARMRKLVEEERGALQLSARLDEAVQNAALFHVHDVGEQADSPGVGEGVGLVGSGDAARLVAHVSG